MTSGSTISPDLLNDAYNKIVSGESFRPSSADEIAKLARLGFTSVDGEVKVSDDTELLDLQLISNFLSENLKGRLSEVEILPCVESTNDLMQERARSISIDGMVVMAEVQTAGRGRRGRRWETPFGKNIAMSLGVGLDIPASRVAPLSLVVGIATAEALQAVGVPNVGLKWPNDILVDERKVGGILTELATVTRPVEVVVGIGINVGGAASIRDKVEYPIADVCDYVQGAIRNQLAGELINRVVLNCERFEESGLATFLQRWPALDVLYGRQVAITGPQERMEGRAQGIDSEGRFLLEDDIGKMHATIAGDVSLRELP
ncbi:MAG: biotin--[acetyl-CoA-carboxylase] ligase [Gammaproteobacteria bacterium]|nr:biotin--[acetyl-CoA-carboxylase] ligase [Gammaproteobacteria bacterium]